MTANKKNASMTGGIHHELRPHAFRASAWLHLTAGTTKRWRNLMSEQTDQKNAVAFVSTTDPFKRFADAVLRSRVNFEGDLLKFTKEGTWRAGKEGDEVPLGTELVALIHETVIGHTRWHKGKPVDYAVGRLADGFVPDRDKLGDLDSSKWDRDPKGLPVDPWQLSYYLQFANAETEKVLYTYSATSAGGQDAVANLADAYADHRAQDNDELPLIELGAGGYNHPRYGRVHTPQFDIVGWVPNKKPAVPLAASDPGDNPYSDMKGRVALPAPMPPTVKRNDLDDEIPY